MSRYNNRAYFGYRGFKPIGIYMAEKHIEAYKQLEYELGGVVSDVKEYLYSLSEEDLKLILDRYELVIYEEEKKKTKGGARSARLYAEKTLKRWKSGEVEMSGIVAERFFKILPIFMPLDVKYQLIDNLYNYLEDKAISPDIKVFYVGYDVNLQELQNEIRKYYEKYFDDYKIPKELESRFNWLSQNDVLIKQDLINHFNQNKRSVVLHQLKDTLVLLSNSINSGKFISNLEHSITIKKKTVKIIFDKKAKGIMNTKPKTFFQRLFS